VNNTYTLVITTANTVRFSRPLVDALEPRELKHYFTVEVRPDLLILRRAEMGSWCALNCQTQYIGSRMLAQRMLDNGFRTGVRYEVTLSGDSLVLACRNHEPAVEPTSALKEDTYTVSNEERRERQAKLLQMIHGKAS
jgi:hypothetical protein